MKRYSRDPYFTIARFDSQCSHCQTTIRRGEKIFYYPSTKSVLCNLDSCAGQASREFTATALDEEFYGRT